MNMAWCGAAQSSMVAASQGRPNGAGTEVSTDPMERKMHCRSLIKAGLAFAHVATLLGGGLAFGGLSAAPAQAVIYCKTVGYPKGCVVRPTAAVVYCTAVGVPVGCRARRVVRAPAVGVNTRWNRGGPVNRVGRR
jgi:hypothetical protein